MFGSIMSKLKTIEHDQTDILVEWKALNANDGVTRILVQENGKPALKIYLMCQ